MSFNLSTEKFFIRSPFSIQTFTRYKVDSVARRQLVLNCSDDRATCLLVYLDNSCKTS